MATRSDLKQWTIEALQRAVGTAHIVEIAKDIWKYHESELRDSGDLFFTWHYDMRWAGTQLRESGTLESNDRGKPWTLVNRGSPK
jgi:hypothetical protein